MAQAKTLRKELSFLTRLNKIGVALSAEHNLLKLMELIMTETRQLTHADGGSIYIQEGKHLHFQVAQTESLEKKLGGGKLPFKASSLPLTTKSIAGYVAITESPLNIQDVYALSPTVEYQFNPDFDRMTGYRTRSILVVP